MIIVSPDLHPNRNFEIEGRSADHGCPLPGVARSGEHVTEKSWGISEGALESPPDVGDGPAWKSPSVSGDETASEFADKSPDLDSTRNTKLGFTPDGGSMTRAEMA